METLKFKTTIKCAGCVAQVTPFLNNAVGENNWEVDVQNPDKVLTITSGKKLEKNAIIETVKEAGFKAELVA
jgi:copper chaperone